MKSSTSKPAAARPRKRTRATRAKAALNTCPIGGAGWCPYPFTIEQLEKKLKAKAQEAEHATTRQKKKRVLVQV